MPRAGFPQSVWCRWGELVERPEELQLRGTALYDTIRINARMAPDLFTWNAKGVPCSCSTGTRRPRCPIGGR